MKKVFRNLSLLTIIFSIFFISCKKDNKSSKDEKIAYSQNGGFEIDEKSSAILENASFEEDYFIYDEEDSKPDKGLSESVIPGLRKLADYKTEYSTKRLDPSVLVKTDKKAVEETKKEKSKSKKKKGEEDNSFFVEEWGPQGEIVSVSDKPSFYVIFSKPVRPLTALEKPSAKSEYMSISPKLEGVFRWYGTQHLSFEATEAPDPSVEYTITVSKNVKSLEGDSISGDTTFTTTAEKIEILQLYPSYIGESEYDYNSKRGALPPYDKTFFLRLNYAIPESRFNSVVTAAARFANTTFTLTADPVYSDEYLFSWGRNKTLYSQPQKKTNTFIVHIKEDLPKNDVVVITASVGRSSDVKDFNTVQQFKVSDVPAACDYSGKHKFPLSIKFSQVPDIESVVGNIVVDGEITPAKENFEVNGTVLKMFDLPFDYDQKHAVTIKQDLKDIYGQKLGENKTYRFKTLSPQSYIRYIDSGMNILEAQFPHKYLFEYQNVYPNSYWSIEEWSRPFDDTARKYANCPEDIRVSFKDNIRDQRIFEEIDLNPYLNKEGFGTVRFATDATYPYYNNWRERYETSTSKNVTTIQVTDLGATVRFGINKAVVLVSSLKTGKPVQGAMVYISPYNRDMTDSSAISSAFNCAQTDENGLAVIEMSEADMQRYESLAKNDYQSRYVVVYIEKGADSVMFRPTSHWIRGYDINERSPAYARDASQQTFMFVDRGLYRPGETVTFRGIDRDLKMGKLSVHTGNWTIEVKENNWRSNTVIANLSGSVSSSGGFYGSFKVPDDAVPGTYALTFKRTTDRSSYGGATIYFQVAEFERLKFEASAKIPEVTYYGGDTVSGEVSANYLAGGALAGARYEARWFKQPSSFSPNTAETKNYFFNSGNYSESRDLISESSGALSADGKVSLPCKSNPISDGRPYVYRLQADITDVSNQEIRAQTTVLVHPAAFYVGIGRPSNISGFAKKDQKLEFPYIVVTPDGKQIKSTNQIKELNYKLQHEEWKMAHEQSIYNSVYTRYQKEIVVEQEGKLTAQAKGSLSLTPKSTGWYILEVSGVDSKDNPTIAKYSFYVTGGSSYWYNGNDSSAITLTPNQTMYNPGETAEILLESPLPSGDYLITIEREGILSEEVRHFDSPANVIEVPIKTSYVPIMYVAVSSYSVRTEAPKHEYGEVDMDKPKGYFGVTSLYVNPNVKSFKVDIECDKPSYRPGEEVTVTLKATRGGQPVPGAELTFMAVDRGVIDLINYHVPNPISYFYSEYKYPLCVTGGDDRAYLMDPVTYSVKDLAGGDGEDNEEKEDERKDFNPTAVFEPVLFTDDDGIVTFTFKMPDSLTTYRMTAFGVSDDLFALQEDEIKVQNPVNVQQIQPKKLRVRDTAECGVLITNLGAETEAVTVSLEVRQPNGNTVQDEREGRITIPGNAFVDGPATHTVNVESGYSSVVYFDVAATAPGTVELVYTVKSANLKEKLVSAVNIEETYVFETVTLTGSTEDSQKEQFVIPGFTKNMKGDLKFTLDATRLGPLASAINYVFDYPYGCLEQRSSKILPLLIFEDYIDVFELDSRVSDNKRYITSELKYWSKSQLFTGGFPYWPGGINDSIYVSARIGHICAIAKKHGYTDKEIAIDTDKLYRYLSSIGLRDSYTFQKAYITYVLSLMNPGSAKSQVQKLLNDINDCNNVALAYLGLACLEVGDTAGAEKCGKELRKYIQSSERSVTMLPKDGKYFDVWYTSDVSNLATALQLYVSLNPDDKLVDRLINTTLAQKSVKGYWNNTSDTAKVLEAVYTYIKKRNLDNLDFTAAAEIAGTKVVDGSFKGVAAKPVTNKVAFTQEPVSNLPVDKASEVEFTKNGEGTLYYTMEMRYALPDEILTGRDEGLNLEYTIIDVESGKKINLKDPVVELISGRTYKATVQLVSPRDRTYVAVRAPIPSGAEIIDSTFVTAATVDGGDSSTRSSWRQWLTNKYIRDNEVQFFWDRFGSGRATVSFTFRASRRGVYPTPPVQGECMYEPEIFGRTDGNLYIIK